MKLIACLALQIWLVLLLKAEGGISAKSSDEGANEVVEGIQDRFRSNFDAASRIPISIENTMSNSVEQQVILIHNGTAARDPLTNRSFKKLHCAYYG
ncbi:hypothetical protein D918_02744 [Trichuris suis]|nr:hypothetical protein D918_02744 [Trichuris suis]